MRFKRLRTAVGISIVVFIFIIANVLIFGSLQNAAAIPNKTSLSLSPSHNNANLVAPSPPVQNPAPIQAPAPSNPPTTVFQNFMTRAS